MLVINHVILLGGHVCDHITEKSEKLEMDDLAMDLTTVKALQRDRGIERELAPIKDKVGQVSQLGKDVIDSFPAERENIELSTSDVQKKWEMLENKARERSKRLEDAVEMQLFISGVETLQQWVDTNINTLDANENLSDVQTAEDLLNKHAEIGDEIRAKLDEFGSLIQLGQKMYGRQPSQEMEDKINSLGEERKAVLRGWQEKGDWLRQVRELQLFNREADQLDASTSAQAKLLENLDVGDNQLQLGDKESAAVINYYLKWIHSTKNKVRSIEFSRSLLSEIENEVLYQSDLIHEAVERGTSTLNSPSNDLMIEFENQQLTSNCLTLMLQWNQLLQSIEEVKKRLQTNRNIRRTDKHRIGEEKKAGTFIEVEKSLEDTKRRFCEARKSLEHRVAGLGSAELTEGHFDGDAILSNYNDLRNDVEHLRTPVKNRTKLLTSP